MIAIQISLTDIVGSQGSAKTARTDLTLYYLMPVARSPATHVSFERSSVYYTYYTAYKRPMVERKVISACEVCSVPSGDLRFIRQS